MRLLNFLAQTAAVVTATMYFTGWIYLYHYFDSFSIGLNELDLSFQDYMIYSYPVFAYTLSVTFEFLNNSIPHLALLSLILAVVLGVELVMLFETKEYLRLYDAAVRVARPVTSEPGLRLSVTIIAALAIVVSVATLAKDAGIERALSVKRDQTNDTRFDVKLQEDGPASAYKTDCTNYVALPEAKKLDWIESMDRRWRILCQIADIDRSQQLQLIWISKETAYLFAQNVETRRGQGQAALVGDTLIFRVPRDMVTVIEVMRPSYKK